MQEQLMAEIPFIRLRMRLDQVDAEPAAIPDGAVWSEFDNARHARPARDLLNEVYAGGGGQVEPYDAWWPRLSADPEFDPELCFVALCAHSGAMIGFAQCWTSAFIKDFAIAKPWQRKGLGRAMLYRVLARFKSRGAVQVDLKVEAGNLGALGFYRALGMMPVAP